MALAEEGEPFSPSRRVMVIASDAKLYVGEESQGDVALGTVLRYTKHWGDWLYVPPSEAWVKTDQVIPVEESEQHFTDVLQQEPSAEAYHHRGIARHALGLHELAIADLDEAVKLGDKSPALFINRANVWHGLGNHRNALGDVSLAIEADPDNALAFNNRSLIWAALGDLDRALEDANQAVRLDPDAAEFYNNRGVTKVKRGEIASAIADYDHAIQRIDDYAEAYGNRGYAAKRLGRFADALADYGRAIELAPDSPQAYNDAAWLLATCSEAAIRDSERAVEYAARACTLSEYKNADFVDTLAAAYAAAGRFSDAVRTQQQALTLLAEDARGPAQQRLDLYRQQRPFVEGE